MGFCFLEGSVCLNRQEVTGGCLLFLNRSLSLRSNIRGSYVLCDPQYSTFWKRQNRKTVKRSVIAMFRGRERNKWVEHDIFRTVKILYISSICVCFGVLSKLTLFLLRLYMLKNGSWV